MSDPIILTGSIKDQYVIVEVSEQDGHQVERVIDLVGDHRVADQRALHEAGKHGKKIRVYKAQFHHIATTYRLTVEQGVEKQQENA